MGRQGRGRGQGKVQSKKQKTGSTSTDLVVHTTPDSRAVATEPSIPSHPNFPSIKFVNKDQSDRFAHLLGKPLHPTKFLCKTSLKKLGLDKQMDAFFTGLGMKALYNMHEKTYRELTFEFLSSFKYDKANLSCPITFRLENVNYCKTVRGFGDLLDIDTGNGVAQKEFDPKVMWTTMTGLVTKDYKHLSHKHVHHPILRIWHQFIAGSIFGRNEPGTFTQRELTILGAYLNPQRLRRFVPNVVKYILDHLVKQSLARDSEVASTHIGGIITYIAKKCNKNFTGEGLTEVPGNTLIDLDFLKSTWLTWDHSKKRGVWKLADTPLITLPSDRLPPLEPLLEATQLEARRAPRQSYLISQVGPSSRGQQQPPPPQTPQHQQQASTSFISVPPYPFPYQDYQHPDSNISPNDPYCVGMLSNIRRGIYDGQVANYYALYTLYHDLAQQGRIDPSGLLPSWANRDLLFPTQGDGSSTQDMEVDENEGREQVENENGNEEENDNGNEEEEENDKEESERQSEDDESDDEDGDVDDEPESNDSG